MLISGLLVQVVAVKAAVVVVLPTLPDNLDSRQIARVVDLLCEGEIEGFPSGKEFNGQLYNRDTAEYNFGALKDVFFDNTQVVRQGADPSNQQPTDYNFDVTTDAVYEFRYGQQDQSVLTNLDILNQSNIFCKHKVVLNTSYANNYRHGHY